MSKFYLLSLMSIILLTSISTAQTATSPRVTIANLQLVGEDNNAVYDRFYIELNEWPNPYTRYWESLTSDRGKCMYSLVLTAIKDGKQVEIQYDSSNPTNPNKKIQTIYLESTEF